MVKFRISRRIKRTCSARWAIAFSHLICIFEAFFVTVGCHLLCLKCTSPKISFVTMINLHTCNKQILPFLPRNFTFYVLQKKRKVSQTSCHFDPRPAELKGECVYSWFYVTTALHSSFQIKSKPIPLRLRSWINWWKRVWLTLCYFCNTKSEISRWRW